MQLYSTLFWAQGDVHSGGSDAEALPQHLWEDDTAKGEFRFKGAL